MLPRCGVIVGRLSMETEPELDQECFDATCDASVTGASKAKCPYETFTVLSSESHQ